MRALPILVTFILVIASIPAANAGKAEDLEDVGFTFGGLTLNANTTDNISSDFQNLPAVVEYYTATWCGNCVDVEHALDHIEEDGVEIRQFHFHRDQDSEDPWGTEEGEARWDERYGGGTAPTVVFNGSIKQMGSVPEGDSLEDDFTALAERDLDLGTGASSMGWEKVDNDTGILGWAVSYDPEILPEGAELVHQLWVTERFAHFPEGSNGVENYPHVVRALFDLGNGTAGTITIDLPEEWDEDDFQLSLIHQVILPEPVDENENEPEPKPEPAEDDSMPSLGFVGLIAALMIAAFTVQRKQQ